MKPFGFRNGDAKAIVMAPKNPRPPARQLIPLQNPAAGAAGNRSDFFPNRPGDVRADGTPASLIRGFGMPEGMHLQRFSLTGRSTAFASHAAPASWAHSDHPLSFPGGGPGGAITAANVVAGKIPGAAVPGPLSMREERAANGYVTINLYDGTQEQIDVSDIGRVKADGTTTRAGSCREHFSAVDIARKIMEDQQLAALHKKSIENGGPGVKQHWITVKANEGSDGVDGLTVANSFTRKWALMTAAEKKERGLEWVVFLLVQLIDDTTLPRYCPCAMIERATQLAGNGSTDMQVRFSVPRTWADDATNTPPRAEHYGKDEDLASEKKPQVHFALLYWGVAPEFDVDVEAQEAHAPMFDLVFECGGDDALLLPNTKGDKKHGDSMSLYYAPADGHHIGVATGLGCCWGISYLLRCSSFRQFTCGLGYVNARDKTELLSIDAAIAHHPAALAHHPPPGYVMPAAGPSPSGIGPANWPPPFDEVHRSSTYHGGLGNLSLLQRWDVSLDTIAARGGSSSSSSSSSSSESPEQRVASAERAAHTAMRALEAERAAHAKTKRQLEQARAQAPHRGGEEARGGEKRSREE